SITRRLTSAPSNSSTDVCATDTAPPPAPVANFTSSCAGLTCSVDASSSTAQASATYSWTWGDATSGTGKTTSHTYGAGGTYNVTDRERGGWGRCGGWGGRTGSV